MTLPAFVVLNPRARGGTGVQRFSRARPAVERRFRLQVAELDGDGAWEQALRRSLASGTRLVIAAGGDGTVHTVGNALLDAGAPADAVLGAIGLGSSNDFHKPVRRRIADIPVRLDVRAARRRDLVVAHWTHAGSVQREVVLVSASVGIAAGANAFFNDDPWVTRLKRHWVGGAIAYAALRTVLRRPYAHGRIEHPGGVWKGGMASLIVLETPYFAGSMRFDLPAADDDAAVTVALIEESGRIRLLSRLLGLCRGRFRGAPGTRVWTVPRLTVRLDRPGDLELDGEARTAQRVRFDVLPGRLLTCP